MFTGWLIDHLARFNFNHPDSVGLFKALVGSFADPGAASFTAQCPGGLAPKGSAADLAKLCHGAMARSTQQGIIVSLCFYAWAALHYALAAIGMVKHMRERAVAQA